MTHLNPAAVPADRPLTPPRRLLILTSRFPFDDGHVGAESYLEREVPLLAQQVEEILVIASEISDAHPLVCDLPDGVRAAATGALLPRPRWAEASDAAASLIRAPHLSRRVGAHAGWRSPSHFLLDAWFAAGALRHYDAVRRILRERDFRPDAIYSFWLHKIALTATWLGADCPGAVRISRAHNYDLYAERGRFGYLPHRPALLTGLDAVLPCSQQGRRYLAQHYPHLTDQVSTAYLGTPDLPDRSGDQPGKRLRILSCSRVVPIKRVELIAQAVARLERAGNQVEWTHVGDGESMASVRQAAQSISHARLTGAMAHEDYLDLLSRESFDVVVNASTYEGLPLSIMEACSAGLPVVATDVGGTSEIVHDGVNGHLLPPALTPAQLAEALASIAALSPGQRTQMRHAARTTWARQFRLTDNVASLLDVLSLPSAPIPPKE